VANSLNKITTKSILDATVATADIADDAVTLAKMAAGTDGQIITYDASGNPTAVGPGTDGQVLTSTGAGSPPAFETPAPGVGGATGVDFNDDVKARFGTGNDLEIYHDGSNSYIKDSGTGRLLFNVSGFRLNSADNSESLLRGTENGSVELYYNGGKTLETTANGITVFDDGQDDEARLIIQGGEGNAATLYLYADDGDDNQDKWRQYASTGGEMHWENYTSGSWEKSLKLVANGQAELYYDNVKKFETTSSGTETQGLSMIKGGEGGEAWLYMYADEGDDAADKWRMTAHTNSTWSLQDIPDGGSWENKIVCNNNAGVELYYNNSKKIETTGSGVTVQGSVTETSDVALKEDITPLSNSLTNLKQLTGYSYKFKDTGVKSLGLTAQEVEKVYPDLVEGEEGQKGLNYNGLIAPLLEAVKELSTEVETLKTKVAALEAK